MNQCFALDADDASSIAVDVQVPPGISSRRHMPVLDLSGADFVRAFREFQRSAAPARVFFFEGGAWRDAPRGVIERLKTAFAAGRTTVEIPVDGEEYLFDFLRMVRVNCGNGAVRSFAWMNVDGKKFFPRLTVDARRRPVPMLTSSLNMKKRKRLDELEEGSDESDDVAAPPSSECGVDDQPTWEKADRLSPDDKFHKVIEKLFLDGMPPGSAVTAVHRCSHTSGDRLRAFQLQAQLVEARRGGTSNVRFAWYGASAANVAAAIDHGFGKPNSRFLSAGAAHGVGVHLSPPQMPHASASISAAETAGEAHVVLCRVIMGRPEKVPAGSAQFHPSDDGHDSGVDDLARPTWYVVWSTHMNSHINPEYVVSFTMPRPQRGPVAQWPASGGATRVFPKLFAEVGKCLTPAKLEALMSAYASYKKGEMNKEQFILVFRSVSGDRLLTTAIKKVRGY